MVLLPLVLVGGCTTEMDCELSGDCVGGECHCDVGWRGQTCSELDLVRSSVSMVQRAHRCQAAGVVGTGG